MTSDWKTMLQGAGASWPAEPKTAVADTAGPEHFGDPRAEAAALLNAAGLVLLPDWSRLELAGADRVKFLHNLCTQDLRSLVPGQGREAFLCDAKGHLVGHVLIFAEENSLHVFTTPGEGPKLLAHLDRYLIREQVTLADRTAETLSLLLAGPNVGLILSSAGIHELPSERLASVSATIFDRQVRLRHIDLAGPIGYLLEFARPDFDVVWPVLVKAGAVPAGTSALTVARLEANFPLYGAELSSENLPQEADRDRFAISFTKGCYLGQETVARIDALGHVNKLLVRVEIPGETRPPAGAELRTGEKNVGKIVTAAWSPARQQVLAFAWVRRGSHQPGTSLLLDNAPVQVLAKP